MLRTDDAGRWTPDDGRWTLDAGPSTPYYKLTGELKISLDETNQLLQEGSVTWDLSHSINIVTFGPTALV